MESTHFCTGVVSNGLFTRARKCNSSKNSTSSCSSLGRGSGCHSVAVGDERRLLNNAGVVADCRLSTKNSTTFSSWITHRRKPRFAVVRYQSNSDPVLGSAEVDESLALEQEHALRNSDKGTV